MSEWIPTPGNGPNGRLPTEADAGEHRMVLWHRPSGRCIVSIWDDHYERKKCVAWMPLPAAFVPPEPEPEREVIFRNQFGQFFSTTHPQYHEKFDKFVKHLPGDCNPDGARAAKDMLTVLRNKGSITFSEQRILALLETGND